jgi:hypothetical protein
MAGKEASYIRAVNKHLPPEVYTEGTANPYRGGTPDRYFEGSRGHLWAEYKFITRIPKLVDPLKLLSPLQAMWLERAYKNNQPVAVIVGCPEGGVILPGVSWREPLEREAFRLLMQPKPQIAEWITRAVMRERR